MLVSPPQCPLGHFWDAVPHLHSVVVPGHHGIGVTREFADVIPTHSLFQEVGDEGTASGIQGEFIGEVIPKVLSFFTLFSQPPSATQINCKHWTQSTVQLLS